jgi:hypothetical protein
MMSHGICVFSADGVYRCPASLWRGPLWGPVFGDDAKGEEQQATDGRSFQALATAAALREAKVNATGPPKGPYGGHGSGKVTAVVVPPA